jgi:hypothetical protein
MGTTLAVATLVVVIATLWIYGVQARQMIRQTELNTRTNRALLSQNVNGTMHSLSRIMLEHPELRPCFYEGASVPKDDPDRSRTLVLAEMFVDFISLTLTNSVLFPQDEIAGWDNYFCDLMRSSPAIQEYWATHREWYEARVQGLLDEVLEECRLRHAGDRPTPAP